MPSFDAGVRVHAGLVVAVATVAVIVQLVSAAGGSAARPHVGRRADDVRSLDGSGNNQAHPNWGRAGTLFRRVAFANYRDGSSSLVGGPSPRAISNRVFNDLGQNIFSENDISQWGWAWGQFIDHDMDLREKTAAESAPIPFDATDPLEQFRNDTGQIAFSRTPTAPGTGTSRSNPRQQVNNLSSFIDASQVYGGSDSRLAWLKAANGFDLFMPNSYLPHASAKPGAPPMDLMGQLAGNPSDAVVAGDVRANENIALTAIQTLFAREHNRIANSLPSFLSPDDRFQIARRVVGAEIQYITFTQFLPAFGVSLPPYRGYDPSVNPSITNEFATVGFRAHSMVHGEFEPTVPAGTFDASRLASFQAEGIHVELNPDTTVTLVVPLNLAFGNPDLLQQIGIGPILQSLGEREYNNDEQIDNSMRSVLFQVPKPGATDPAACNEPSPNPDCYAEIADLGADDIQRGRDHGMPSYNDLRAAYGLAPARSFTDITGESTQSFPKGLDDDNPTILDFLGLEDANGNPVAIGDPDNAVSGVRRTTLAARLRALYGNTNSVDAFVGMVSEPHVHGSDLGPLQMAIWRQQFTALRDGDRFFYANDPQLGLIRSLYGINYQQTLAQVIAHNTTATVPSDTFHGA